MFHPVLTETDIDQVVLMAKEIWTEHYTPIIGAEQVHYMLTTFHSKQTIAEQIAHQHYLYFIIKNDNKNVGYIGVQITPEHLFLSKIYLSSAQRGLGLGKKAMHFIRDLAQQHGLPKIYLTVNKYNSDTIAAYNKFGFVKTGELCADIGNGYVMDDFEMEMTVN